MTTRARKKVKWVEEPFKSIYVSFTNHHAASFLGSVARLNRRYILEIELFEKMMVWSFIEKYYSIPSSKDFSGSSAPYIRITKMYDFFKEHCLKYRIEPCAFKVFRDEIKKHLELCTTKRNGQHAVYLVGAQHPAFQHARRDYKYDCDIFSSTSVLDIWALFGKKKPGDKYPKTLDIVYNIRGGKRVCLRKNFVLTNDEGEI